MKSFKSLLMLGAMAMASSMAWGQTVVAHMQDLVDGATVKTATVSTDWETDAAGGAVYKFTRASQDVGTYLGGIDNEAVKNAFYGSKVVTVAAWVYGRPNGCIFGLGEQNTGIKFLLSTSGSSTTFKTTTKGKADFTAQSITLTDGAWNLVAFSVYGKASGTSSYRYYAGDSGNNYYTKNDNNLSNMADASLCGIGSGNQDKAREVFSSELANLTVIESDGYIDNATIASLVGAAPTRIGAVSFEPAADTYYYLKVKDQDFYVNLIDNSTDRKKDVIFGTSGEGLKFASVAGGYTIENAAGLYVGKSTATDWNMSSANPETWTIEPVEEGYYVLKCDKGYLGCDELKAGEAFYRDKGKAAATVFEIVPVPEFDPAKKYTIENTADKRGKLAYNPAGANYVGLADVTLAPNYASLHASSSNPEVGIEWQLTQVGADKVTLKNLKNDKYAVIQSNGKCVWGDTPYEYVFTKSEGYYTLQGNGTPSSNLLTAACGWNANQGPVYLEGTTVKNEHKFVITEVEEPVAPSYTEEEIAALQDEIDGLTLKLGLVGYPDAYSDEAAAVMAYNQNFGGGITAETYEAAQAALTALYNCADVVLPEADKYYEIKASYHDGTYQYLGFDGTKLSITDTKPMGGSVTFKAESVEGNNVVLSIDGHYVHWTAGEDKEKTDDLDGLNETFDENLNTLVLSKATPGVAGNTSEATPERLFGLLHIQGKSSGTKNKNNLFFFVTRNDLAGVGAFIAGDANHKYYYDNWDHSGHNNTTYFEFVEVEAPAVDVPATAEEIESAQALLDNAGRLGYPKGDDAVVTDLAAAVAKDGVTATELGAAVLAYKNCENVVLPEKNRFYVLAGGSGKVLGGGKSGDAVILSDASLYADPYTMNIASLYYYNEEGNLVNFDGGHALKGSQMVTADETPDVFTFCHTSLTEPGTLSIKNAEGKYLLEQSHNLSTANEPAGQATNWTLNGFGYAPIKVGATGYATAYMPFDLAANPEYGFDGVYVAYQQGDLLKAIAINKIPANTPVIVKAAPNAQIFGKGYGEDMFTPEGAEATAIANNVLAGTLIAKNKPANALVLGIADEVLGFYSLNGTVIDGFKAYYPNATLSNGMAIRFDDTLTAIESAVETAQGHQIFDLQGRRVNGAAHGLFIQNGKKVIK